MKSKFQQRLWDHALEYFTVTNTSLYNVNTTVTSSWNMAANFLWQQAQHISGYMAGKDSDVLSYHHHGPQGLKRACELLRRFNIIEDDGTLCVVQSALNQTGIERKSQLDNALKIVTHDILGDAASSNNIPIEESHTGFNQPSLEDLPNFTSDDILQLLAFIEEDEHVLISTFGQLVCYAGLRCFNLVESDVKSAQHRLDNPLIQADTSPSPIKHPNRAECILLYQKLMPLKLTIVDKNVSPSPNSRSSGQSTQLNTSQRSSSPSPTLS